MPHDIKGPLSATSRAWVESWLECAENVTPADVDLLVQAAAFRDIILTARNQIKRAGITADGGKAGPRQSPAVKTLMDATAAYRATVKQLGLGDDEDAPRDGRRAHSRTYREEG